MFTIIFNLDFNNLFPSTPLEIFSGFIIPLLTAIIATIAIIVNYCNNRKQIKANVITKSRIEWIQDVRQCLYDLNVASNSLRFKSAKLITEKVSTKYTDAEEQYLEAFTYVDASIQKLKMYFPIKESEREMYKNKYDKFIKKDTRTEKPKFGPVLDDNKFLYSHINIRIMIDMYEREINTRVSIISDNSYNDKKISLYENQFYEYEGLSDMQNLEYKGYIIIAEWVTDYLKIEWEEAKKLKK